MDYKLISIAIVFLVFLIIFVKQELTFRKYFGRSTKLDELLQNTERTRMEELHSSIEAEREKLSATITEETTQLYKDLQQKRTELEDSYQSKRDEINQYTRDMIDSSNQDIEMHKLILNDELAKIIEDKIKIEDVLNDLKAKRQNTIKILKEEQKDKNELDYHKIIFTQNDLQDIKQLREIEQSIHNKDVLRKLIYKTYIEPPMGQMFSRVGISDSPGIYKIENILDGKVYIGQSVNVKNRMRDHLKSAVGISTIANQIVHEAMNEEGIENFIFHLIDSCEREKLNDREKYWIDYYQSNDWGYNRTKGGS